MTNPNDLRDEMSFEKQQISELSRAEKMEFYWQKYKVHIVITVLLACLFGSILHPVIHQKETVLSIAYINAFPNVEDEIFIEDFETYLGLNLKKQQVVLDSTYYIDDTSTSPYAATYSQKFSTNAMAGKLDVVLADIHNFDFYGSQGFFQNLSLILPQEMLDMYQDSFYYVDLPYDETGDLVPVGIQINKAPKIGTFACYPGSDAYYGILTNAEHIDYAISYLNYINE